MQRTRRTRTIIGAVVAAAGAVWVGQGAGILRGGSFMVGDPRWIAIGIVAIGLGIGVIWMSRRRPA